MKLLEGKSSFERPRHRRRIFLSKRNRALDCGLYSCEPA
jgi:hypothetical protein